MAKFKNIKISKLLNVSQIVIIVLVLAMGIFSAIAIQRLWQNTETFRSHPFTTQGALATIRSDILNTRLMMEEVVLKNNPMTVQADEITMTSYEVDVNHQINILDQSYLGPKKDLQNVKDAVSDYHGIRLTTLGLLAEGKLSEASQRVRFDGICGVKARDVISKVEIMNDFASNKASQLYADSQQNRNRIMMLLGICIVLISVLVSILLISLRKNILPPLRELTHAADNFEQGKAAEPIHYQSTNELGALSHSFQNMTERIEREAQEKIEREAYLLAARQEISAQAELLKVQDAYYIEKQLLEATLISIGDAVISCDINSSIIFLS